MDHHETTLPAYAEHALNEIDASVFSGDTFHSPEALSRLEWYMARWIGRIVEVREMLMEDDVK